MVIYFCTFCHLHLFSLDAQRLQPAPLGNQHLLSLGVLSTEPGSAPGYDNHTAAFPVPIRAGVWSADTDRSDTNAFCTLANKSNTELSGYEKWKQKGSELNKPPCITLLCLLRGTDFFSARKCTDSFLYFSLYRVHLVPKVLKDHQ